MTSAAEGTTSSAAYFTENWNTRLKVTLSFSGLSFENAGNIMIVTGVAKNVTKTAKLVATV